MNIAIDMKAYIELDQGKNYPILKSIIVNNKSSSRRPFLYDIEIVLSSKNNDELIFLFQETFDIKINPIDGISDLYIDIMNVVEMQVENATYYISGNEEEMFSFYCKSFIFYHKE